MVFRIVINVMERQVKVWLQYALMLLLSAANIEVCPRLAGKVLERVRYGLLQVIINWFNVVIIYVGSMVELSFVVQCSSVGEFTAGNEWHSFLRYKILKSASRISENFPALVVTPSILWYTKD